MAEDSTDGLIILQATIAEWQRKRWLVPNLIDTVLLSTGADSYTIGTGGDFSVPRPDHIVSGFFRMTASGGTDIPLGVIPTREEYNHIPLKGLHAFPAGVFYDAAWPLGVLHFWPIPASGIYEIHLTLKAALPAYVGLTDPINLPPEYISALIYTLACKFAINWGQDPRPATVAAMAAAIQVIRLANLNVPELSMPAGLPGHRSSGLAAGSSGSFNTGWW